MKTVPRFEFLVETENKAYWGQIVLSIDGCPVTTLYDNDDIDLINGPLYDHPMGFSDMKIAADRIAHTDEVLQLWDGFNFRTIQKPFILDMRPARG